jgi:AraC-like DNA-binding protein
MKRTSTIPVSKLIALFTLLERKGIDVKTFLIESGLSPDISAYPDKRISLETVRDLNRTASNLIEDDFIGLHQGEVFTGFPCILGYVLMNCRDVAEAIEKYTKYQQIVDEEFIFSYHIGNDQVLLQYRIADSYPQDDRHHKEHLIMGMVTYSRILTGRDVLYREVHFTHKAPRHTNEYERLFRCKPRFSSHMNALIFDRAYLRQPILQPNRELLVVLESYAREVLNRLKADDSLANKVKQIIVDALRGESPTIGTIGSSVHMSVRNLQQKLKDEGTTYSTLLAESRRELAQAYLKDRNVPIGEIAYLLGFSEPSVFHRTFKHWTGTTPALYRRQAMDAMAIHRN